MVTPFAWNNDNMFYDSFDNFFILIGCSVQCECHFENCYHAYALDGECDG